MPLILAIDQSTSATKAVLFDHQGCVIDRAARDHAQHCPAPGCVEHDAEEIWANVQAVVATVATRHANRLADIAGISLANQRETFVVFDRATGRPLRRAVVWQDRRGDDLCRRLAEQGSADLVHRRTGLSLDGYFSGSKIRRLAEDEPAVRDALARGRAIVGTIDAYLVHRLTDGRVCAGDSTNASRTLLFDIDRLAWDTELCALFRVPVAALPEVRHSAAAFGETTVGGVLPRPIPIIGVIGDSQASLFAQRCIAPGTVKATFGTGTSILLNAGHRRPHGAGPAATALAWVIAERPTYALEGMINSSAATIAWLRDRLGLIADAAESEAVATSVPDNGGVYLVPAFAGLSPPYAAATARAAIVGLTSHSGRAQVVRAGLEAIGYQVRDVLAMLAGQAGVAPAAVFADGGPTRNAFLMQFVADVTGVELAVTDVPESSALGAAMMGMLGLGWQASPAGFSELPRSVTTYRPRMPGADVERLVRGWHEAVRRVELEDDRPIKDII
ncbi:MAG: glycerol kinase [Planctomycetaceae bacterium]